MVRISVEEVTDAEGSIDPDKVSDIIMSLHEAAERDRKAFQTELPDETAALTHLREGVGRAVGLYVLLRTGGRHYRFSPDQFATLEEAMNTWLELYANSYGVDLNADFSIRTAAELLIETNDLVDVAEVLTGVSHENA